MKRFVICALALALLIISLPLQTFADEESKPNIANVQVILLEDGASIEIITEIMNQGRGTVTGTKVYNKRDSDNNLDWTAKLTATFTYNGSSATCTSASCSVTIYDSDWFTVSNMTSKSGNTATANLLMGYRVLGVPVLFYPYTITLSCDANGNLN